WLSAALINGGKNGLAMSATMRPMLPVRPVMSARAARLGRYPIPSAAARTRLRVSALTRCGAENVRETVETWTPEAPATSRMVTGTAVLRGWVWSRAVWPESLRSLMQTVAGLSTVQGCVFVSNSILESRKASPFLARIGQCGRSLLTPRARLRLVSLQTFVAEVDGGRGTQAVRG